MSSTPGSHPQLPGYAGPEYSGYELVDGTQRQPSPEGTNGFAIAALLCGLFGFVFVLIVFAVIFGCIALSQIKKNEQKGRGSAIGGLVAAGLWTVGLVVAVTLL